MMTSETDSIEIESVDVDRLAVVAESGATVTLTRDGRPVAAIVGVEALQRWADERELLRRLALGELESAVGDGDGLETVLEACRQIVEGN